MWVVSGSRYLGFFSPFLFLFFLSFLLLLSPTVSPGPASSLASVLLFDWLGFLCSIYGFLLMLFWFALIESASLLFVRCALRNRFPARHCILFLG